MLLHDVIMDVVLLPAICRVSGNDFVPAGQCTGTPRRARETVELLRQETPNFLASKLWPPNSPDLSPVDYEISAVMQHCVYHRQIYSVDELKRRLIDVWRGLGQSIFDKTIDEDIERASMLKEDISSTACELTVLILSLSVTFKFNVTCLTVSLHL